MQRVREALFAAVSLSIVLCGVTGLPSPANQRSTTVTSDPTAGPTTTAVSLAERPLTLAASDTARNVSLPENGDSRATESSGSTKRPIRRRGPAAAGPVTWPGPATGSKGYDIRTNLWTEWGVCMRSCYQSRRRLCTTALSEEYGTLRLCAPVAIIGNSDVLEYRMCSGGRCQSPELLGLNRPAGRCHHRQGQRAGQRRSCAHRPQLTANASTTAAAAATAESAATASPVTPRAPLGPKAGLPPPVADVNVSGPGENGKPFRVLYRLQSNVYGPWSEWSACSEYCLTSRHRNCTMANICGGNQLREYATCSFHGSNCQRLDEGLIVSDHTAAGEGDEWTNNRESMNKTTTPTTTITTKSSSSSGVSNENLDTVKSDNRPHVGYNGSNISSSSDASLTGAERDDNHKEVACVADDCTVSPVGRSLLTGGSTATDVSRERRQGDQSGSNSSSRRRRRWGGSRLPRRQSALRRARGGRRRVNARWQPASTGSANCGLAPPRTPAGRVVGGRPTPQKARWPWYTALFDKRGRLLCGGTLITARWVVTAAHCFRVETPDYAVVGVTNLRRVGDPRHVIDVLRYHVHPQFKSSTIDHDVGLVRLAKRVVRPIGWPICLPSAATLVGTTAMVVGFGQRTATVGVAAHSPGSVGGGQHLISAESASDRLMEARLPIVERRLCSEVYPHYSITTNMLCAGYIDRPVDACRGDSGGPLQAFDARSGRWALVGITSFGDGCGEKYGIYARVAPHIAWIKSIVRD